MRKLPYQSSLQFIQRPQLLWNDIGDRKLWRGIQWTRRGPTVPSRLSWNAYQSNIPKPRSGVRWKHGMRRFSEYGNVASRKMVKTTNQSWWEHLGIVTAFFMRDRGVDMWNLKPASSWLTSDFKVWTNIVWFEQPPYQTAAKYIEQDYSSEVACSNIRQAKQSY